MEKISEKLSKAGIELSQKEKEETLAKLKLLIHEFKIPEKEAVRTILNHIARNHNISNISEKMVFDSPEVKLDSLENEKRVTVKAKVIQLWDSESPSISQVGLIGDETGTAKFVIWKKSEKPKVQEGKCYLFKNVVADSFNGRKQIKVTKTSEIIEIDEEIETPKREIEVIGAMVHIQKNSGLIARCPKCKRVVSKGVCTEHGKVKGKPDLRIKAIIDDGASVYEVVLNEENITHLTGIDLNKAIKMAKKTLDRSIVLAELKKKLLGRYYRVKGTIAGRYLLVSEINHFEDVEAILNFLPTEVRE